MKRKQQKKCKKIQAKHRKTTERQIRWWREFVLPDIERRKKESKHV